MAITYKPPSVTVKSIPNSRVISITDQTRFPAVVGIGPMRVRVVDAPISRSNTIGYDALPYSGSGIMRLTASPYPSNGAKYPGWNNNYGMSGSVPTGKVGKSANIYWDFVSNGGTRRRTGVAGASMPSNTDTYYVSYDYLVDSSRLTPTLYTDSKAVLDVFGSESTYLNGPFPGYSGSISIAANLALENGAPGVICVQVSGSATSAISSTAYTNAFTLLEKRSDVSYVVPVYPNSLDASTIGAIQSAALHHCNMMSNPDVGLERSTVLGLSPVGGVAPTVSDFVAKANALVNRRAILVAPGSSISRTTVSGDTLTLNGSYVAAAVAGTIDGQESPVVPITGSLVTGVTLPDDFYTPGEMNLMASNGVCVVYSKTGINRVRHGLTTDPSSVDTKEISIVASDDLVRRVTRASLTAKYIGKGIVIDPGTVSSVANSVKAIWEQMVKNRMIYAYGTKNDPTTGEVPITANQDPNDPTLINVSGSVKYLYPLNYIQITFSLYV